MRRLLTGIGLTILLFVPVVADAQILVAGEGPVVYGHHHLNTTNMDAQKKFYVDTLGVLLLDRCFYPKCGGCEFNLTPMLLMYISTGCAARWIQKAVSR